MAIVINVEGIWIQGIKRKMDKKSKWFIIIIGVIALAMILTVYFKFFSHTPAIENINNQFDNEIKNISNNIENITTCKFPYLFVESNSTNITDIKVNDSWESNITIPLRSGYCMGNVLNYTENTSFGNKINYKCDGDTLPSGTYPVTCTNEANKSIVICYIKYPC